MKKYFYLCCIFCFSTVLSGQSTAVIQSIQSQVQTINIEKKYALKKLDYEYFVNKKEDDTDGGQELTGYYNKGALKKMVYQVGISYATKTLELFYSGKNLIFIYETHHRFPEKKNAQQAGELDYSKLDLVFEGRYYFDDNKLIKTLEKGTSVFMTDQSKEKQLIIDSQRFKKELENQIQ